MAFITLSGTLLDPNGDLAVGDQIRFTHNSTTGQTVQSAVSIITVNPSGTYSLPLQYGLVLVEYKDVKNHQFKNLGVATVNATNTATSIPELLNALVPVSSAELIEFQAILADCVTAQNAAEDAADISEAFANQLTTSGLIASTAVYAANVVLDTSGFTTSGDGGSGQWKQNGVTGQTVSQTPAQLGDGLLNDGLGNQWALVENITVDVSTLGAIGFPTNDTLVFVAAFEFTKNKGIIVVGYGKHQVDAIVGGIQVYSDFDFSNAEIVCSTIDAATPEYTRTRLLFKVKGDLTDITSSVNNSQFVLGATYIPSLEGYTGHITVTSNVVACVRWNGGSSSNVLKGEPNFVANGHLMEKMRFGFVGDTGFKVNFNGDNTPRTCKFSKVTLDNAKILSVINVEKNFTTVESLHVPDTNGGELAAYEYYGVINCSHFNLIGALVPATGTDDAGGIVAGYLVTLTYVYNTYITRVVNRYGWSSINGNFFKRLVVTDSQLWSLGAHAFSYDIYAERVKIYRSVTVHGGGICKLTDCDHIRGDEADTFATAFVVNRLDYGASFDGDIIIENLNSNLHPSLRIYTIVEDALSAEDHGYVSISPNVYIDGLHVRYRYTGSASTPAQLYTYTLIGSDVTNIANKRFLTELNVNNVRTSKADASVTVLDVLHRVNYIEPSLATALLANFLSDVNVFVANYRNDKIPTAATTPDNDAFSPVYTYNVGDIGLIQKIHIENSDYVGFKANTPYQLNVKIKDQVNANLFRNNLTAVGNLSSTLEFDNCRLLGVTIGPAELRMPTTTSGCTFDYFSYYTGISPTSNTTLGFNGFLQIVNYNGCAIVLPRYATYESVKGELKARTLADYKLPTIYET